MAVGTCEHVFFFGFFEDQTLFLGSFTTLQIPLRHLALWITHLYI